MITVSKIMRDELLTRLDRLDEDAALLFDDDRRFHMIIVGGSALILLKTITRATHDVDALNVSHEIYDLLEKYDINTMVGTYVNNFPYNYEDRLVPLKVGGRKIDYYSASLEDIVIAKLYASRPQDIRDITDERVRLSIDWARLEQLALSEDEAAASALNERAYKDFLHSYFEFVERWKPCENSLSEDFSPDM